MCGSRKNAWNRITIEEGDITRFEVDAIVNAANESLMGGGGVDGAIHRAAGPELLKSCMALVPRGCQTGDARITPGFQLKAQYVIHTVGPVYRDGQQNEATLLASCYLKSLALAAENGAKTVAFPAISCGVYRFPLEEAAEVALRSIHQGLLDAPEIERVSMVLFGADTHRLFMDTHSRLSS